MERKRSKQASLHIWVMVVGLLSQNLLIPVMSTAGFEDQKNYYSPDPHAGTPPTSSHTSPSHGTPSHGSGGSYGGSPSSHGTPSTPGSTGSYGSSPSSHGTPSHRGSGGSSGGTPSSGCGTPPRGGQYDPTPAPPTGSGGGGGGGYYNSPPSSGGSTPSTPSTPTIVSPPTIIIPPTTPTSPFVDPGTPTIPGISIPSSPPFDPNSPPFTGTCNYWLTHPQLIWGLLGWFGTVGGAFGVTSVPGFGANLSIQRALSNTRRDGLGALYRQGTASLLNSMVNKRFSYTTKQVRDSFVAALSSNKAAAAQAQLFQLANEGRIKPRS